MKPPCIPFFFFFLPFLTPGVVLCHLGVVLIPPFAGVGLSPQKGGFIPPFGHWGVLSKHQRSLRKFWLPAACFKLLVKGTIISRKRHRFQKPVMPR